MVIAARPLEHGRMTARAGRAQIVAFTTAAAAGLFHAAFSLYWSAGGTALTWSLGDDLVASFQGREWLLAPIGLLKLVAAIAPLVLLRMTWPAPRLTRGLCGLGGLILVVWGGANTLMGNLVLAGVIHPARGFDRLGMIGHAWLWDPLFLIWGAAVVAGLLRPSGTVHHGDRHQDGGDDARTDDRDRCTLRQMHCLGRLSAVRGYRIRM